MRSLLVPVRIWVRAFVATSTIASPAETYTILRPSGDHDGCPAPKHPGATGSTRVRRLVPSAFITRIVATVSAGLPGHGMLPAKAICVPSGDQTGADEREGWMSAWKPGASTRWSVRSAFMVVMPRGPRKTRRPLASALTAAAGAAVPTTVAAATNPTNAASATAHDPPD